MCVIVEFAFGYSTSTDYGIYRSTVTAESVLFCIGVTYCDCNHYVVVPGNPSPPLPLNKRQCMVIVCSFYDSLWYIFVIVIVIAKQYILHLVIAHLRKLMIIIKKPDMLIGETYYEFYNDM